MAAILVPVAFMFAVTPSAVLAHAGSFVLGAGFFGAKFVLHGVQWLLKSFPMWPEQLRLSNTILFGVPTDAQLALVRSDTSRETVLTLRLTLKIPKPHLSTCFANENTIAIPFLGHRCAFSLDVRVREDGPLTCLVILFGQESLADGISSPDERHGHSQPHRRCISPSKPLDPILWRRQASREWKVQDGREDP